MLVPPYWASMVPRFTCSMWGHVMPSSYSSLPDMYPNGPDGVSCECGKAIFQVEKCKCCGAINGKFVLKIHLDPRYVVIKERLGKLSTEQIQSIVDNIDQVCFDTYNYDVNNNTFCPLAIAHDLHNKVTEPTDETIKEALSAWYEPVNVLKGVYGNFYTDTRKEDLLYICSEILTEKSEVNKRNTE